MGEKMREMEIRPIGNGKAILSDPYDPDFEPVEIKYEPPDRSGYIPYPLTLDILPDYLKKTDNTDNVGRGTKRGTKRLKP